MVSGYLQAAAYTNLSGVGGMPGWRWLFIIDGIFTIPVALIGYFVFPGVPDSPKTIFLTHDDITLAKSRLERAKIRRPGHLGLDVFKRSLKRWHIWVFVFCYMWVWGTWRRYSDLELLKLILQLHDYLLIPDIIHESLAQSRRLFGTTSQRATDSCQRYQYRRVVAGNNTSRHLSFVGYIYPGNGRLSIREYLYDYLEYSERPEVSLHPLTSLRNRDISRAWLI